LDVVSTGAYGRQAEYESPRAVGHRVRLGATVLAVARGRLPDSVLNPQVIPARLKRFGVRQGISR
jgi:hypothetical protein